MNSTKIFRRALLSVLLWMTIGICSAAAQEGNPRPQNIPTQTAEQNIKPFIKRGAEIQLSFATEILSRNLGTWRTFSLDFKKDLTKKRVFYGALRQVERAGRRDGEAMFGGYAPFAQKWAVNAEASFGLRGRFLPKVSAYGEIERRLKKGFVLHGGVRHTRFVTADKATSTNFQLEKYWGNNRFSYTATLGLLNSNLAPPSHRVTFNHYYGENVNSFGITLAAGQELENTGTRIVRSNTKSAAFFGRHWLSAKWALNYEASFHQQGNLYNRRGIGFGVRYRF